MTIQNGLGAEELVRAPRRLAADLGRDVHERTSATPTRTSSTSSTRRPGSGRSPGRRPTSRRRRSRRCSSPSGLHARAFPDLRPAQWSKLIFNATVNTVAALTDLPHVGAFAAVDAPTDLGRLVRDLMDEGKAVAAAAGVELHEDPWEMNVARGPARRDARRRGPLRARAVDARGRPRAAGRPRSTSSPARSSARPSTARRSACTACTDARCYRLGEEAARECRQ